MKTYTLAFWIGLFLFSIYLLSFSGKLHIMDEFVGLAVGNNLVQHGRADVNQFIWTNHWHTTPPGIWGQDNNLYTKKAPGISLAAAPLIWLGHNLPDLNAVHLSLLTSAIVTAVTAGLLFIWLRDLEIAGLVALLTALGYGLTTLAWVYARFLWEHSIMAFLFLAAIWALHRAGRCSASRCLAGWLLLCSLALAISLTMRFEAIFAVGLVGLYIFLALPPLETLSPGQIWLAVRQKTRWIWTGIYLVLPVLTIPGLLYFNYVRFGSISETGYNREILFQRPWEGSFGLLFSPSTGLFIYAPLAILIFWGIPLSWRRLPRLYFWLIISLTVFYWIFYGSWFSWGSTWVWGPRFMLHTLPLLMLFVAEPLDRSLDKAMWPRRLIWSSAVVLAVAGFMINFLGIAVDLNEHFLRLGRNDNFVFNWAAFPPLGHWRILQEGLIDLIWLRPQANGWLVEWSILAPALALFIITLPGLLIACFTEKSEIKNEKPEKKIPQKMQRFIAHPFSLLLILFAAILLTYLMMRGTARVALASDQARADQPVLERLAGMAQPGAPLLISMPPFGDVQEVSTHMMAYLDQPLPTYAWIETEPKAIQPDERERLWQAVNAEAGQVWLFERWLTPNDPLSPTAAHFNQQAFPIQEWWFEQSGKLTAYARAGNEQPALSAPLDIPFEGGLKLVDFAIFNQNLAPGEVLKVRLTWQAAAPEQLAAERLPVGGVVGFVHLLDETSSQNIAQHDRLLLDLQNTKTSPLLPGQTISQGYGLRLPDNLAPGSYPLIAGLYQGGSGERLRRADGSPDDFLYLTNVTVEPDALPGN